MEYGIGIVVALLTIAAGRVVGFDRDRAFYPTVLIVTASYYVLFAAVGSEPHDAWLEVWFAAVFAAAAIRGFTASPWWIIAGFLGHAVFDVARPFFGHSHAPATWPGFCMAYDIVAAAGLALLVRMGALSSRGEGVPAR